MIHGRMTQGPQGPQADVPECWRAAETSVYVNLILKQQHLSRSINRAQGSVFTAAL